MAGNGQEAWPQYAGVPGSEPVNVPDNNWDEVINNFVLPDVTAQSQPPSGPTLSQSELQRRQEELERKAAELAAREEALRTASTNIKENNWPPIPKFCPVGPCLYQDINVEIPPEFQKIVNYGYRLWMINVLVLFVNFLGGLAIFSVDGDHNIFSSSILMLIFLTPASFMCWFRPLYKAFRNDSAVNFMVFFFVFFFQCIFSVFWAIGLPTGVACGLITAFKSHESIALRVFIWLVAIVLIINAASNILILLRVHNIYSSTGASLAKAQEEFRQNVMTNDFTRQATSAVATSLTRSAMNQAFGGTGTGTGNQGNTGPGLRY
ncbi:secretory carrier-associated membrane protein 1-like isoform X2 [Panonychus citri]|uniref:secretory carrier-associated membrane protein 1-like isoform X2 n=1 Tax=Panonychus citri TaxID=50023 RepID=UPI00230743E3|nr:secretory carrier-associated membrane protein 1-like isoform X2 [Panonychus citri]